MVHIWHLDDELLDKRVMCGRYARIAPIAEAYGEKGLSDGFAHDVLASIWDSEYGNDYMYRFDFVDRDAFLPARLLQAIMGKCALSVMKAKYVAYQKFYIYSVAHACERYRNGNGDLSGGASPWLWDYAQWERIPAVLRTYN